MYETRLLSAIERNPILDKTYLFSLMLQSIIIKCFYLKLLVQLTSLNPVFLAYVIFESLVLK